MGSLELLLELVYSGLITKFSLLDIFGFDLQENLRLILEYFLGLEPPNPRVPIRCFGKGGGICGESSIREMAVDDLIPRYLFEGVLYFLRQGWNFIPDDIFIFLDLGLIFVLSVFIQKAGDYLLV